MNNDLAFLRYQFVGRTPLPHNIPHISKIMRSTHRQEKDEKVVQKVLPRIKELRKTDQDCD